MAALSAEGVRTVCQLQREEGRQALRTILQWEAFDEVQDQRRSIQLDCFYSGIVFAVEKGFPWLAAAEVGRLLEELLNEIKGLPVSQAVSALRDKLAACETTLSPCQACVVWEYLCNTLLRHYQLYQFVLCEEREAKQTCAHLEVCVPPQPLSLAAGVDAEVWQYQQQLAALAAAEAQKRANMLRLRESLHLEREHMLQRAYDELKSQAEILDRQGLETLVKDAIGTQIRALRDVLHTEIQTTFEILELQLQKKALLLSPPVPYPPPPLPAERAKKVPKAQPQKKK